MTQLSIDVAYFPLLAVVLFQKIRTAHKYDWINFVLPQTTGSKYLEIYWFSTSVALLRFRFSNLSCGFFALFVSDKQNFPLATARTYYNQSCHTPETPLTYGIVKNRSVTQNKIAEFKLHQSKRNLLYLHQLLQWQARDNKATFSKGNPA